MTTTLHVQMRYDAEADAWWAESDDVPGLVTEANTSDALMARVEAIAPELLALNRAGLGDAVLEFHTSPAAGRIAWAEPTIGH